MQKKQIGETVRELGLAGEQQKKGTPTMGGLIILAAILIPTLLFAQLHNVYVILMITVTVWLGFIGFLDDYIKVFKKNKKGLAGKFKVVGQIGVGIIVKPPFEMDECEVDVRWPNGRCFEFTHQLRKVN